MANNTWRNISRIGGRVLGTIGGTLVGQPQLGYQVGSAAGDLAGGEAATRMKEFANYSTPNPATAYSTEAFNSEKRHSEQVELPDPMDGILNVADTAINATGLLNNIKNPLADLGGGAERAAPLDKMKPFGFGDGIKIQGRTDLAESDLWKSFI